jgi:Cu/Ag efflux protein CusF
MSTPCRVLSLALAALALAGCGDRAPPPAATAGASARRYTVRGEVVRIEGSGDARELLIRHEAIPDFADRSGAKVGMSAMVMPFAVAPGVALEGVAPGTKIRFRLAVDFGRNRLAIESLERLPPDTALDFGGVR